MNRLRNSQRGPTRMHIRRIASVGLLPYLLLLLAVSLSACPTCSEPPITWTQEPPGSVIVCVGESVSISASASDSDLYGGWPACPTTPDSVDVTIEGQTSFASPGLYQVTVKADDAGSRVEDGFITKNVSVRAVAVGTLTAPEQCVVCTGTEVQFSATSDAPGYESKLVWSGGGSPAGGSGASFTTSWSEPGEYTVTVSCCDSSESAGVSVVGNPCEYTSCGSPTCLDPVTGNDSLDGCATGLTTWSASFDFGMCFDCSMWHPVVTQLDIQPSTTYDSKGRTSVDTLYTCAAVIWVDHEYDYIKNTGGGGCDEECDPADFQCQYYSPSCLAAHEGAHASKVCERGAVRGAEFISTVEQMSSSACSASEAAQGLSGWVQQRQEQMRQAIDSDLASAGEDYAYEAEAACLLQLKAALCAVVGSSCTWCE